MVITSSPNLAGSKYSSGQFKVPVLFTYYMRKTRHRILKAFQFTVPLHVTSTLSLSNVARLVT